MVSRSALRARAGFPCANIRPARRPAWGAQRDTLTLLAIEALLFVLLIAAIVAVVARSEGARMLVTGLVGAGMA